MRTVVTVVGVLALGLAGLPASARLGVWNLAPGLGPAIVLVAASGAVTVFIGTVTFSALQVMVPSTMRGMGVALTGLVDTLIGATTALRGFRSFSTASGED